MPQIKWSDNEFLEFFAVEPDIEDYGVSYSYEIARNELKLVLSIWPHESAIHVTLFRVPSDSPLFSFAAFVYGEARVINDQRGCYLDFERSIFVPSRFWCHPLWGEPDSARSIEFITIRVAIDPDISIQFVKYESRT